MHPRLITLYAVLPVGAEEQSNASFLCGLCPEISAPVAPEVRRVSCHDLLGRLLFYVTTFSFRVDTVRLRLYTLVTPIFQCPFRAFFVVLYSVLPLVYICRTNAEPTKCLSGLCVRSGHRKYLSSIAFDRTSPALSAASVKWFGYEANNMLCTYYLRLIRGNAAFATSPHSVRSCNDVLY